MGTIIMLLFYIHCSFDAFCNYSTLTTTCTLYLTIKCWAWYCIWIYGLHLYHTLQYRLTFTHSCTHSHSDGGVSHAGRQPARWEQIGWGVLLRDTSTLGFQVSVEPGFELTSFRLPANPLDLLSHMPPNARHKMQSCLVRLGVYAVQEIN